MPASISRIVHHRGSDSGSIGQGFRGPEGILCMPRSDSEAVRGVYWRGGRGAQRVGVVDVP